MANEWACVHCTFLNGHNALACGMCASLKPAAAPASRIAETSKVGSAASNGEQWACLQCTYLNGSDAAACDMCFSPKPAAALPSGVPLAAAAVGPVDAKQTMVEPMEEQEDEDEEDEDEQTAEAKKLSLQCRAGEAQWQQVDQGQTERRLGMWYVRIFQAWCCACDGSRDLDPPGRRRAATSPTRPAPREAKEASSPIPRRGVSVALLLATYQRWHAAGRLAAGATTDDVVRDLVKPATADQKCSYVELLARSQDPQDRAGVATATVFLSHAWKYSFKNVVEAIAAHWPDKGDLRSRTFLWFDIFTVNQHETAKVDQNFWFNAFRENVKDIGHTVLILSPWRNPLPLTRSWCLWEIFCTRDTGATFEICLSQAEAKDFENVILNDFDSIVAPSKKISNLGVVLYEQGRLAEARPLLQRAASGFETVLGAVHPTTQGAKSWLAKASK
eukprot:g80800.t1